MGTAPLLGMAVPSGPGPLEYRVLLTRVASINLE